MIPYGRQHIDASDVSAVSAALTSAWLTQGPAVPRFEASVASRCNARYAVAANSATSALHLACLAVGVGTDDVVWTVPNTFVASANCARYCGADVDFIDIDYETGNMSVAALAEKLAAAEAHGRIPKAVIPVHFAGMPCDMEEIAVLSRHYGFRVIEDASHAIGASYRQSRIGSCQYSDITVFSFHPVKIITTGEGGMALTNDESIARAMARTRSHGITREAEELHASSPGPWYYEQQDLGFNYRMTDLQAALGLSQMEKLDGFIARRELLADAYDELLRGLPLEPLKRLPDRRSAWHLYVVHALSAVARDRLFEALRSAGIGAQVHYIPVHTQPYYARLGFSPGDFPQSEAHYARAISLPLYFDLTEADQRRVVETIRLALQ